MTTTTTGVTPQQIADVFITSIEGGSTYWADSAEFETYNGTQWSFANYQDEATFSKHWRVRYHDQEDVTWSEWKGSTDLLATRENLPEHWDRVINDEFDAGDADAIVQAMFFGEIIYG